MFENRFEVPFHQSLNRPLLILGAEREPVLGFVTLVVALVFDTMTWWGLALGIVVWVCGSWGLARMAASDPQLTKLWKRSMRFRRLYQARATPFARLRQWK